MKILFLICIGLFANGSIVKNGNFVFDTTKHTVWQDSQENTTLELSYDKAKSYCENGTFGGHKTWRLPTRDEYKSILDKNIKIEHKINKAFKHSLPSDYWIGETTWRSFGRYAYYVFLKSGTFYYQNKTYKKLVRCVR
jgi:hypothetical protein